MQTTDEGILWHVKHVLEEHEAESWEDLDPKLKAAFNRGIKQADNGEVTPHKIVMARIKKKFLKK